ncbi:MAG: acyl-protein synthetase [Planctomycetes bacterium]|nr:acyl-protein synthetase [Planctomycetota bacterium]
MSLETLIASLSHDEKLVAMDLLWQGLSADPRAFASPPWHEKVLSERLANPAPGEPLGIAAAKAEVKDSLDARRTSR